MSVSTDEISRSNKHSKRGRIVSSIQGWSKKKKIVATLVISLLTIIAVVALLVAMQIKSNLNKMIIPNITTESNEEWNGDASLITDQAAEDKAFRMLVMGLDYRDEHEALLTDSIMVLQVDPDAASVKLLSIPRDLLVHNSKGNLVKINSLFSEGLTLTTQRAKQESSLLTGELVQIGSREVDKAILSGALGNTRSKLEELLDITIDYTMMINFNTIVSLVDALGGIEIDVKRSMKYKATNLYLDPGLQRLNGEDALGYARFREDDRGSRYFASDFERGRHQQEVVKALVDQLMSWGNVTQALGLLEIVSQNVQTDMNEKVMASMISKYYNVFNGDSISSIPFPEHYSLEGDVIIPDDALRALQAQLREN